MYDLINYDNALDRFQKTLKINSLPLTSWDFYGTSFDRVLKSNHDIKLLLDLAENNRWAFNTISFEEELINKEHTIVVTDTDLHIVYASQNIWEMNRYHPEEIIGQKPKIFQGKKTCKKTLKVVSNSIRNQKPFEVVVLNYRKDGSTYNCHIHGLPIFNKAGEIVNFIAFEKEVA
ncbi:PAS domain-containing protein [Maribacter sp. MMG018]|uniref:PAS domain-containing protein n=1 Tax=Maribacter sp. MMG018 TaxID=2822688 RepID=UPI001B3663A6|nr:PAS domain-containing protein [Maribacter sp. MMG018]MBQ4913226.1 PAS domain-containing protein [Maribacter sp. MMG018]